ncbi:type II toxin-antitoxin system death-on-curing family toxin [Caldicellulosiruptoraceae bacterium PP1]
MKRITIEKVIEFHKIIINKTGGLHGIRDINLLYSSIENAFQTYDEKELYPTDIDKISMICYSVIRNHPFIDGNKRIGVALLCVLCDINNISINCSDDELVQLALNIAQNKYKKEEIKEWIISHTVRNIKTKRTIIKHKKK